MKCLYAISVDTSDAAMMLAKQYEAALSKLSEDVIFLGSDLRAFSETHSEAVLKLDDTDWSSVLESLSGLGERNLTGKLFWSSVDAQRIQHALDESVDLDVGRTVSGWLGKQVERKRSILLLAS